MNNKIAVSTFLLMIKPKIQNKQAEQKQHHRYRECFVGFQMGGGWKDG